MSSRWLLTLLLVPLLSSIAFSQKLINGFTREFAIQGLPTGFSLKSFDVTGDSVADFFVLTGNQLLVFDGKTFSMIFKDSTAPGTANLSPADVNRDGSKDLVASVRDTAIVVWFGSDFLNRRVFHVDSGFISFAVRNREDGQIEFSLAFRHTHCWPYGACFACDEDGHLLRYVDSVFIFSDSIHLDGAPTLMRTVAATIANSVGTLSVEDDERYHYCNPSYYAQTLFVNSIGDSIANVGNFSVYVSPSVPCSFITLLAHSIGNIDADSSAEFIGFVRRGDNLCPSRYWYLRVFDVMTGFQQWERTDSLDIRSLFIIDLNGVGMQEIVSYEIQNTNPGLTEYRSSDGTTLGFTELPFAPATLLMDRFGQPPALRVLLGHKDSLVVYGIGCAANKGDMNADGNVTVFDVTLELNCAFLGEGDCNLCFADVNCDGVLTAADVVLELLAVFLGRSFPCS